MPEDIYWLKRSVRLPKFYDSFDLRRPTGEGRSPLMAHNVITQAL
ncbi:hypothetical protein YpMG051020_2282 [Yersinia pestis biovar Orientalis str. MG05-1020]|uniref:Uncharacterized protein n=1 Tax=Yersinia pestis biovar Orientalis str. IP275 TaxID=373665 RepID=A0AAV3BLQ7_YERPE|nr:hypothetical protein YPIP275_3300 [Yersinia pestis biovar Orientalis str. IP275]EDR38605.1 hypothetical protein YpF1991016_4548 [Yersinia pestis biovar Orientalis str. F1991016]EDR58706.1 hypothetical protein YpMG051020_2282 [Yersinia pestis biovar Orientalis str. MG05-1020]